MTFARETLDARIARYRVDIGSLFRGRRALQRRSVEDVIARMIAGYADGLHGRGDAIERDILPQGASDPAVRRWAEMLGITGAAVPGVACVRSSVPVDASELGAIDDLVTSDGATWVVTAVSEAGDVWIEWSSGPSRRLEAGEELSWSGGAWAGVNGAHLSATTWGRGSTRTIPQLDVGGLRREVIGWYRSRRYGRLQDWEAWARAWPGVHSIKVDSSSGINVIVATYAFDGATPSAPTVSEMAEASVTLNAMKPLGSGASITAALPTPGGPTITAFSGSMPNADAKAAVETEVEALMSTLSPEETLLGAAVERVALAVGVTVEGTLPSGGVADVSASAGKILVYSGVTWP